MPGCDMTKTVQTATPVWATSAQKSPFPVFHKVKYRPV